MSKNKFFITIFLAILLSTESYAATSGSYLGIDGIFSKTTFRQEYKNSLGNIEQDSDSFKGSDLGFGLNYKYAINFDGLYLAPGIFIEKNNLKTKKSGIVLASGEDDSRSLEINYRSGIRVDIGYDITDYFAIYALAGYSQINYKTKDDYYTSGNSTISQSNSGFAGGGFYGAGLKFDINDDFSINSEVNFQDFTAQTARNVRGDILGRNSVFKAHLVITKVGIAYRF
mgnify:CR=1 FL=1